MNNLNFIQDNSYQGKTKKFHVYSTHSEVLLGIVKWNCGWRQYWLEVEPYCGWSWDCLLEVSNFIKKLMEERKNG